MIKNVPLSFSEEDILSDILSGSQSNSTALQRQYNKSTHPIAVCVVDLTDNDQAKFILSLSRLYYAVVTVEIRRK